MPIKLYSSAERGDDYPAPFSSEGAEVLRPTSGLDRLLFPITELRVAVPLLESEDVCSLGGFYDEYPMLDSDPFEWQEANDPLNLLEHLPERLFYSNDYIAELAHHLTLHKDTVVLVRDYVATYRIIFH